MYLSDLALALCSFLYYCTKRQILNIIKGNAEKIQVSSYVYADDFKKFQILSKATNFSLFSTLQNVLLFAMIASKDNLLRVFHFQGLFTGTSNSRHSIITVYIRVNFTQFVVRHLEKYLYFRVKSYHRNKLLWVRYFTHMKSSSLTYLFESESQHCWYHFY